MSGEARYTERDLILAKREAHHDGALFQEGQHRASRDCLCAIGLVGAKAAAARLYPLADDDADTETKRRVYASAMYEFGAFTWDVCVKLAEREYPLPEDAAADPGVSS